MLLLLLLLQVLLLVLPQVLLLVVPAAGGGVTQLIAVRATAFPPSLLFSSFSFFSMS
jgi:hypothetical protein